MRHHRQRVRRLREPSFRAPVDRTSDPQIPLTRPKTRLAADSRLRQIGGDGEGDIPTGEQCYCGARHVF